MRTSVRRSIGAALCAAMGVLASAPAALASFSPFVTTPVGGEKTVAQILAETYGGAFTLQAGTKNYGNGSVLATRIDDNTAGNASTNLLNTPTGDRSDRLWSDGIARGIAQARYAAYNQQFGYFDGWSGGSYHNLFDVGGYGDNVVGESVIDFGAVLGNPAQWRWGRSGSGLTWSSNPADNYNGEDHLVTYLVTGVNDADHAGKITWMLFWEDKKRLGDMDYNDLAVEIIAEVKEGQGETPGIPEPITAATALLSAVALAHAATKRRG